MKVEKENFDRLAPFREGSNQNQQLMEAGVDII